jgi:hypothetical protein
MKRIVIIGNSGSEKSYLAGAVGWRIQGSYWIQLCAIKQHPKKDMMRSIPDGHPS